jgi:uncharacterized phage protein gp47/JayE
MDTSFVGSHLDAYSFARLIEAALAQVPNQVDKRQGSIIYDTLSVGDVQLAEGYVTLKGYYLNSNALTAQGEYLDLRAAEAGISRKMGTAAVKLGTFLDARGLPVSVPIGSVFSTIRDTNPLNYIVTDTYNEDGAVVPGSYQMTCETLGTAGNDYVGPLLQVTYLSDVASAEMTELLIPGSERETDADLLARYLEHVNRPAFGGNIAQYRQWTLAMDGVGAVQVYPVWDGGGTVKVCVIGADHGLASSTLIDEVQTALDPELNQGIGLGLAPIGHVVTVVTPDPIPINVQANLTLRPDVALGQVETEIKQAISAYLLECRKAFGSANSGNAYAVNVYRARMSTSMMQVDGVVNVTDVMLNGADADLLLTQTPLIQQLPVEGTVTLHAI